MLGTILDPSPSPAYTMANSGRDPLYRAQEYNVPLFTAYKTNYFPMAKSSKKLNITPLGDRVVVKPLSREETSASGIIIPDTIKKEKAERGTVVATGPGKWSEDGDQLIPMTVKKGDEVLFEQTYRDPVEIDGEEYYIFEEGKILAVIPQN